MEDKALEAKVVEIKLNLWCDKEGHHLHYKVCRHRGCDHLEGDEEHGFVCHFENSKTKRAKKGKHIRALKKAR